MLPTEAKQLLCLMAYDGYTNCYQMFQIYCIFISFIQFYKHYRVISASAELLAAVNYSI